MRKAQPARLLSFTPGNTGTHLLLLSRRPVSVGSAASASLKLAGQVAKRHAAVQYHGGRYFLTSLDRDGQTFVNDQRLSGSGWLKHGDNIRFGPYLYRFIDPDGRLRRRNWLAIRFAATLVVLAGLLGVHAAGWDVRMIAMVQRALSPAQQLAEPRKTQLVPQAHPIPSAALLAGAVAPSLNPAISTPRPVPTQSAPVEKAKSWIERLNHFRVIAGLAAIKESPSLSASVDAHAHYLMANFADKLHGEGSFGNAAYREDKDRKEYSPQGAAAAANSQIAWGCGIEDQAAQIDRWIAGPFHRLEMLDPTLQEAGFGEMTAEGCWVAALRLPPVPDAAGPYPVPIMFPPNGATVSIVYSGGEFPNPLAACPDYASPTGLPITLQIGRVMEIDLGAHSLTEDGHPVEECAFSAKTYHNPDRDGQEYGRWELRSNGAVVMIPRALLKPGAHYQVSIVADGRTYSWSFAKEAQ